MAAPTYGAYQPGAVDPWPIESVLAKEAITSPADAQGLLSSYAQQRQAQGYVYGQEADQQHEFAKQQLAQQMAEARLKALYEMTGKTGGNALIAGGGIEGLGPSGGGNPDAWAAYGRAGEQHEFAQNLGETGKGIESLSRAGQDLPIQQIPGLQGYQTHGAGEHSDITVERLKANVALQLAAAKAARGARAEKDPKAHYDFFGPPTDAGQPNKATISLGLSTPPETVQRARETISRNLGIANPSGGNSFGATSLQPSPGSGASATPAPARSATSLPRAPAQSTQGGSPPFITDRLSQAKAKVAYEHLSPADQQQVWANRPGGVNMPIAQMPNGPVVFVGKNGRAIPMPALGG